MVALNSQPALKACQDSTPTHGPKRTCNHSSTMTTHQKCSPLHFFRSLVPTSVALGTAIRTFFYIFLTVHIFGVTAISLKAVSDNTGVDTCLHTGIPTPTPTIHGLWHCHSTSFYILGENIEKESGTLAPLLSK